MAINKKVEQEFNKQINEELFSEYLYLAMSAYFEDINLPGFANWMRVQAKEEHEHGMRFYNHLVERGGRVELDAIEKPQKEWKDPLDAFEAAYKHEQHITARINKLVELASAEKDHPGSTMLIWFVDEQVEEEQQTDEIAQKLKMIKEDAASLYMLDKELGARVFTPAADMNKE